MDDGLIVGIDLGDMITQVHCAELETDWAISTVLCKKKQEDVWYIGKEAYSCVLEGAGILSDKLVTLAKKDGTATFEDIKYTGEDLLAQFLFQIFEMVRSEAGKEQIGRVVVSIDYLEQSFIRKIALCTARAANISEECVHIISREESFVYYILSQRKDIWNHEVGVFELSKGGLTYFNFRVRRGLKDLTVFADSVHLEESFSPDVLMNESGKKLGDQILSSCAERLLRGKLFSAIILTGDGFERTDWAPGFMSVIGQKRRVYLEKNLFAIGCVCKAAELAKGNTEPPFTCICNGHLDCSVAMDVMHSGKEKRLVVVPAGACWYEATATAEFILGEQKELTFLMIPVQNGQSEKRAVVSLQEFPDRPPRTTRIELSVSFLDARTMEVVVKDLGFGELFAATEATIRQEVTL